MITFNLEFFLLFSGGSMSLSSGRPSLSCARSLASFSYCTPTPDEKRERADREEMGDTERNVETGSRKKERTERTVLYFIDDNNCNYIVYFNFSRTLGRLKIINKKENWASYLHSSA